MDLKKKKQNENIEWFYAHEADLTIGEAKISQTTKIILRILLLVFIILIAFGIYFHNQVYDFIANPKIIVAQDIVEIGLNEKFNPENYIISEDSRVQKVIYPDIESIDFSIEGEYELEYLSYNSIRENSAILKIKVVDNIPPTIKLKPEDNFMVLTRGKETENFNPLDQIESYSDNYTPIDQLKLEYTNSFNWDDNVVRINYVITDLNGLSTTETLIITVIDESHEHVFDNGVVIKAATTSSEGTKKYTCQICGYSHNVSIPKLNPAPSNNNSGNSNSNSSGNSNQSSGNSSSSNTPTISGVHNFTITMSEGFDGLKSKASAVSSNVPVRIDFGNTQLAPGAVITITYINNNDGTVLATCTCTVTE